MGYKELESIRVASHRLQYSKIKCIHTVSCANRIVFVHRLETCMTVRAPRIGRPRCHLIVVEISFVGKKHRLRAVHYFDECARMLTSCFDRLEYVPALWLQTCTLNGVVSTHL